MSLETFFSVSEQTMQFLMSVVLGAGLGVLYDCFRAVRILFPHLSKKGFVIAEDIIFVLCYGAAIFFYAVLLCRGQVRFFCIIGSLLGFVLYIVTIGNFIMGIIKGIVSVVYKILHKVYSAIFAPIVKNLKVICPKSRNIFVHSYKNKENKKINPLNHLKNKVKLLYNKETKVG